MRRSVLADSSGLGSAQPGRDNELTRMHGAKFIHQNDHLEVFIAARPADTPIS